MLVSMFTDDIDSIETTHRDQYFWWGMLVWVGIAFVLVMARGVRWDENYEFAQVLLGQVVYPESHPLHRYVHGFYSLQTWLLAAVMAVADGPLFPNLLRNVLGLLATVLPAYALAGAFSKRILFAHVAAVLMLVGMHVHFYSNYPVQIWPDLYSNGHVGTGWALLSFGLFVGGHKRSGLLMLGFMPAIHLGQAPPVYFAIGCIMLWELRQKNTELLKMALGWALPGLLVSMGLGIWIWLHFPPSVSSGAWGSDLASDAIFKSYMTHHASHRAIPPSSGHVPLILLLGLTGLGLLQDSDGLLRKRFAWIGLYGLGLGICVWGITLIHYRMGTSIPSVLVSWMPYRLLNHVAPLIVGVCIGYSSRHSAGRWGLTGILGFMLVAPVLGLVLPESFYTRYIAGGEIYLFALAGFVVSMLINGVTIKKLSSVILLVLPIVFFFMHQFALVGFLLALNVGLVLEKLPDRPKKLHGALAIMGCLVLGMLVIGQLQNRVHLPVSDFEKQVASTLAAAPEDAVLLVPYQQEGLQGRLGVAVMADMATLTWIPYRSDLRPGLEKMYRELYELMLVPDENHDKPTIPWFEVWPAFTLEDWQRLSREYKFTYVLAPDFMDFKLESILAGDGQTLWQVPK